MQIFNLIKLIEAQITAVDPDMPKVIRGVDFPKDKDDFIRFDVLADLNRPSRDSWINTMVPIELACYSKLAMDRTDKQYKAAWRLSDLYFNALNQKRYRLENTCIQLREARRIYLDLTSLGDFAKPFDQQSPKLNLECVIIEVDGYIIQTKG